MLTTTHPDFADGNVIILDEFDARSASADECEAPSDWNAGTILFDPYI